MLIFFQPSFAKYFGSGVIVRSFSGSNQDIKIQYTVRLLLPSSIYSLRVWMNSLPIACRTHGKYMYVFPLYLDP